MAEAEQAIITMLLANAPTAALVSTRIYFAHAPQIPTLPYIVIHRISGPRVHSLEGASGLVGARIQVDQYASNLLAARGIANAVRSVLDGYRGIASAVSLQAILLLDESDIYEAPSEIWRVSTDYRVWYQE